jgi:predicted nucleotidyltransferase
MNEKLKEIKKIIIEELEKENIKVHKIILFGSRARGDFKEDSDWDILVVVDRKLNFKLLKSLIGKISLKLAYLNLSCDIIIREYRKFYNLSKFPGSLDYYVKSEGIEI